MPVGVEAARRRHAEAREGGGLHGRAGHGVGEGVGPRRQGLVGEDLLARVAEVAIGAEVDPGVELSGGGRGHRHRGALAGGGDGGEGHAVFVVEAGADAAGAGRDVVTRGRGVGLAVRLGVHAGAEEEGGQRVDGVARGARALRAVARRVVAEVGADDAHEVVLDLAVVGGAGGTEVALRGATEAGIGQARNGTRRNARSEHGGRARGNGQLRGDLLAGGIAEDAVAVPVHPGVEHAGRWPSGGHREGGRGARREWSGEGHAVLVIPCGTGAEDGAEAVGVVLAGQNVLVEAGVGVYAGAEPWGVGDSHAVEGAHVEGRGVVVARSGAHHHVGSVAVVILGRGHGTSRG